MLSFVCKTINDEREMHLNNVCFKSKESQLETYIANLTQIQYQEIWFQQYTLPRKLSVYFMSLKLMECVYNDHSISLYIFITLSCR